MNTHQVTESATPPSGCLSNSAAVVRRIFCCGQPRIDSVGNWTPAVNPPHRVAAEEAAALVVTRALRRGIANRTNAEMLSRGTIWTTAQPSIRSLESLSASNVSRLRGLLGTLTAEEVRFVDSAFKTNWFATHYTKADLRPEDGKPLAMFSRQKLLERNSSFSFQNTKVIDSFLAAHDDFVFFSVEPGPSLKKSSSRFGPNEVRIPIVSDGTLFATGWASLNDMVNPGPPSYTLLASILSQEEFGSLVSRKRNGPDYVFSGKDILPGIVLSIVVDLREDISAHSRGKALAAVDDFSLNRLVNGLYRPELKVPRHLFVKEYQIIS